MFLFKRKKRVKGPTPPWMMVLVAAFVAYAIFTNSDKKMPVTEPVAGAGQAGSVTADAEKSSGKKTPEAMPSQSSAVAKDEENGLNKLINVDALQDTLFPKMSVRMNVKDDSLGEGIAAICGQKVTINYSSFTENDKEIEKDKKLSFQLGEGKVMPALEIGVLGMKKNGKRTIFSSGKMAYGFAGSEHNDIPELSTVRFDTKLLELSPELPDFSAYRVIGDGQVMDDAYACGATIKLHVLMWDVEGKKLYDSRDNNGKPLEFTLGRSEVFLGLEQGALLMEPGMHRNLIVPPALQKTLNGNPPKFDFPFPKNQTVLVDIEAMP